MSGICKYPESICPHMTVLKGKSYCDATPCQLTGELPKQTFGDWIRGMTDEELAKFLSEFMACKFCECYDEELDRCWKEDDFMCIKETIIRDWLKQPVEE